MFSISTNVMSRNTHRVSLGHLWLDQRSHASRFLSLKKKTVLFCVFGGGGLSELFLADEDDPGTDLAG